MTELREWNFKDSKAKPLIIQTVSDETLTYINIENTASKMMKELESSFVQNGYQNQLLLWRQLFSIKLKYGENANDHISVILHFFY